MSDRTLSDAEGAADHSPEAIRVARSAPDRRRLLEALANRHPDGTTAEGAAEDEAALALADYLDELEERAMRPKRAAKACGHEEQIENLKVSIRRAERAKDVLRKIGEDSMVEMGKRLLELLAEVEHLKIERLDLLEQLESKEGGAS